MTRCVVSACSRCSISQRDDSSDDSVPCATRSTQALAMPCRRNALSSASTSRMVDLLAAVLRAQAVIAASVGTRCLGELEGRLGLLEGRAGAQPAEHVKHMFGTYRASLQHQLDGDQHTF